MNFSLFSFPATAAAVPPAPATRRRAALAAALAATLLLAPASRACSVCGCSLSSDWGLLGYADLPGLLFSLRYEYFDQTELRSGRHVVDRAGLSFPNGDEIQLSTTNRNLWLGAEYQVNPHGSLALQLPYHERTHATIAEGDTDPSTSRASGLGDVRVLARWTPGQTPHGSWALQAGLKLPTGRTDETFATGPQAGEVVDRGLQLGTGSIDLLLGAAWFGRPATSVGLFAQAQWSQPLTARDDFRPSASLALNGGVRWLNSSAVTPQLQLNLRRDGREHGANADTTNSGGTVAYLSPGATVDLGRRTSVFAFVQLPVYQRYTGLQLAPRWLLTTGLRWSW